MSVTENAKTLAARAASANDPHAAQQLGQAALNVAHAANILASAASEAAKEEYWRGQEEASKKVMGHTTKPGHSNEIADAYLAGRIGKPY